MALLRIEALSEDTVAAPGNRRPNSTAVGSGCGALISLLCHPRSLNSPRFSLLKYFTPNPMKVLRSVAKVWV
jgi:hypothetical protein